MKAIFYKKVLFYYLFFSGLFLLTIICLNYYLDAGNQFYRATTIEEKIANAVLNQQNIKYNANYNERTIHKLVLEKLKWRPEVLVLGSSRAMLINHNAFRYPSFYNGWVSSASLEDHLAVFYLYQKRGWKPDVLVIGLDPWLLDKDNNMKKWKMGFNAEYYSVRKLLGYEWTWPIKYYHQINGLMDKYAQLLSFIYFKSSLIRYFSSAFMSDGVILNPKDNVCPSCNTRQPDGTNLYPIGRDSITTAQINTASLDVVSNFKTDFGSFTQLDPDYMNVFEAFVRHLTHQHVKVVFYLPPLSPLTYTLFKENKEYKLIFEAEDYFISIAKKYHATIIGSYNPKHLSLQTDDFLDGFHLKKRGLEKIFKPDRSFS